MTFAYKRKKRLLSLRASKKLCGSVKTNWRIWLFGAVFISAAAGVAYAVFFSGFFSVKEIGIKNDNPALSSRIRTAAEEFLNRKIFGFFPGNNILAVNSEALGGYISDNIPQISDISVKKTLEGKIEIFAEERKPSAIWCRILGQESFDIGTSTTPERKNPLQADQCYFSDEQGFLFREAPEISGTLLPTFYGRDSGLKSRAVASSSIVFAAQFRKELKNEVEISAFWDGETAQQELIALTGEGWPIYLNQQRSASAQAKIVKALLSQELKNQRNTLNYIDLRVANRVYYK